jgi:hypothetical protein
LATLISTRKGENHRHSLGNVDKSLLFLKKYKKKVDDDDEKLRTDVALKCFIYIADGCIVLSKINEILFKIEKKIKKMIDEYLPHRKLRYSLRRSLVA